VATRARAFVPWFVVWLAFLPLALMRAGTLTEADTFWQVRTGLLTISQGAIPTADSFSWTAFGEPWTLNSWGFNVLVAGAYRLGGLAGVALASATLVMLLVALILLAAWRLAAAAAVTGIVLFAAALPLLPMWLAARPQLVDYIAVVALTLLLGGVAEGRKPVLAVLGIGLLCVVWVNLHATALIAIPIAGACALVLLARRSTRRRGLWALAATAAAISGILANPYGVSLLAQAAQVKGESAGSILEWQSPALTNVAELVMMAIGVLALALAVRSRNAAYAVTLVVTLLGSAIAIRFAPLVLVVAIPVLASAASRDWVTDYMRTRRVVLAPGAAALALVFLIMAIPALGHVGQPAPSLYPQEVISRIPSGCKVFTSYLLGGFIELIRPDVRVNVDSRNDLFGEDRVLEADRTLQGRGDVTRALAGAACALVPPSSGLALRLNGDPAWRLAAAEGVAALYVRREP
jgi:hypothetical protein